MTTNEDLEQVVAGFRAAEDSMRALTDEATKLQTATEAISRTDAAVAESAAQLTAAASGMTDLSVQLGTLASQLASTSEALLAADPEGVKRELARSVEQTERLRSRIDETAGETRSHFEMIGRSINQVKIIAGLAVVAAIAAAVLAVAIP